MDVDLSIAPPGEPQIDDELVDLEGFPPEGNDDVGLAEVEAVTEAKVRRVLRSAGGTVHYLIGADDVADHWRFTDDELDDLVPPLTEIIRRREALRRALARGDELAVAMAMGEYLARNIEAYRNTEEPDDGDGEGEADRAARGEVPGAGQSPYGPSPSVAAPGPGGGPPSDRGVG